MSKKTHVESEKSACVEETHVESEKKPLSACVEEMIKRRDLIKRQLEQLVTVETKNSSTVEQARMNRE